ncbi:MAG: GntR family transcriptional regulator [Pseudomonadota bacterium]
MTDNWNDNTPIYRQIRDRVVRAIMDGSFVEGDSIPSVRSVAAESKVNHLTVGKAYQELVDEGVLEMRRGLGMFVKEGARATLLALEKEKFISSELPALVQRIQGLGISIEEIVSLIQSTDSTDTNKQ